MNPARVIRHLLAPSWAARRAFPRAAIDRIEAEIRASEARHRGEIRFAVEAGLDLLPLLRGVAARARAVEVFAQLGVWDTRENTGVLIYVQWTDRDIEIVADRGINGQVPQHEWDAICRRMEDAFREQRYEAGALAGIREVTDLLIRHFPAADVNADELANRPVML